MDVQKMASSGTSTSASQQPSVDPATSLTFHNKPIACLVIGLAGSGKTTLMQRINAHVHAKKNPSYFINLDPAVLQVPFGAHVDIRDTVNYKQIMKQFGLGPNGGIVTALNLFATRFDQVVGLIEKRASELEYVFVDTPGQIEIFTWSASGAIITEALASVVPTVVLYVVDTPRAANPATFMSNMLYACSILYKTRLPFILVFSKTDVANHKFAVQWMTDFDAFQNAMASESSYSASLTRSMSLVLDEFYNNLKSVGVSAVTGDGMDALFEAIKDSAMEYESVYRADLITRIKEKELRKEKEQKKQLAKVKKDIAASKGSTVALDLGLQKPATGPDASDDADETQEYSSLMDYVGVARK